MSNKESPETELNVQNHLAIDVRMAYWSPWGLGATNFQAHNYINMCLEPVLGSYVPQAVRNMFDRAKAIMSYGIYHYPLFTAGEENIHRLLEAAIFHFSMQNECPLPKDKATFWQLINYCEKAGLIREPELRRWHACRQLRNMASHQKRPSLQHPNGAVSSLDMAKELIEALFVYGPPNFTRYYKRSEEMAARWQ